MMDRWMWWKICLDRCDLVAGMSHLSRWWRRFGPLQVAALLLGASRGSAQIVRGQTVLSSNREPAPGVVVQLLDSAGAATLAWTLSDEQGRFVLRDAGRGQFIVRAIRIGLRPLRLPIVLGAADTSVVLRMLPIPLSLPPVVARDSRSCNTRPDSGLALGTLWNDAESALLAASITRASPAYTFAVVEYTRDFDFRTRELEAIAFKDLRSSGARPWASVPPWQLRRNGFVVIGHDSATFIAPDIETLVSRDFVDSHCFELSSHDVAADSLIGIDFTPAGAVKHPEVRGTIWFDRATHELRSIDFHYVHLGLSGADSAAGGQVKFAPLRTGGWIVTDWSVQSPIVHLAIDRPLAGAAADRLRVSGSILRDVRSDSGILWSRNPSTIELHITSGPEGRPLRVNEAVAYLLGSDLRAATDSNGVVSFSNLVGGSYLVDIGTRELDVLGWARRRVRVNIEPGQPRKTVDVQVESSLSAARAVCGGDAALLSDTTGVIVGRLTGSAGPVADRPVRVSWIEARSGSTTLPIVSRTTRSMAGDGRFIVCGVPLDQPIQINADDATGSATVQLTRDQVVAIVAIAVAQ
jgi:hypothetical protein